MEQLPKTNTEIEDLILLPIEQRKPKDLNQTVSDFSEL